MCGEAQRDWKRHWHTHADAHTRRTEGNEVSTCCCLSLPARPQFICPGWDSQTLQIGPRRDPNIPLSPPAHNP
ncbi:hypothetical protein COCON_G00018830 [Conger conger]|uniref:Uncharacterized protein n=1 Tax=Conger conger TaxID=82655 RepID=A0A9Q1E4I9_CONCO|nr:hypothetical protein COCON_G00018830 [Conger conger]